MINQTIHSFKIQKEIGSGGMATVYLAENNIGKKVAIKVLHKEHFYNEQTRQRFVQEAKVMARMTHENICSVISLEDNDEFSAIIMEYLEGTDLENYVDKNGKVPETKVINWLKQMAPALDYAHNKGYIHRDIKPSNLFLIQKGLIKIMDFGIAKAQNSLISTQHTGTKLGSPMYMSPEQIISPKYVDHKTDIYSLGVTLYYLLSGKMPYDITTQSEHTVKTKITKEKSPKLPISNPLYKLIQKATEKDKDKRPNTVTELLAFIKPTTSDKTHIDEKPAKDGKWGFIDKAGNEVTPFIYDIEKPAHDNVTVADNKPKGLNRAKREKKQEHIGKTLLKKNMLLMLAVMLILIAVWVRYGVYGEPTKTYKNGKYGFTDISGNAVIPFVYDRAWDFS